MGCAPMVAMAMTMTMVTVDVFDVTSTLRRLPIGHALPKGLLSIGHPMTEALLLALPVYHPVADNLRLHRDSHLHLRHHLHLLLRHHRPLHHLRHRHLLLDSLIDDDWYLPHHLLRLDLWDFHNLLYSLYMHLRHMFNNFLHLDLRHR